MASKANCKEERKKEKKIANINPSNFAKENSNQTKACFPLKSTHIGRHQAANNLSQRAMSTTVAADSSHAGSKPSPGSQPNFGDDEIFFGSVPVALAPAPGHCEVYDHSTAAFATNEEELAVSLARAKKLKIEGPSEANATDTAAAAAAVVATGSEGESESGSGAKTGKPKYENAVVPCMPCVDIRMPQPPSKDVAAKGWPKELQAPLIKVPLGTKTVSKLILVFLNVGVKMSSVSIVSCWLLLRHCFFFRFETFCHTPKLRHCRSRLWPVAAVLALLSCRTAGFASKGRATTTKGFCSRWTLRWTLFRFEVVRSRTRLREKTT